MTIYLYVKQCTHCGLKYFGKTENTDPFRYRGSGKYWIRHLKKHKSTQTTLEIFGFDDQELCSTFALIFSEKNDIVQSKEWANLKSENGRYGGRGCGFITSDHTKSLISDSLVSAYASGSRKKVRMFGVHNPSFGCKRSEHTKQKQSLAKKDKTWEEIFGHEQSQIRRLAAKDIGTKLGYNNKSKVVCVDLDGNILKIDREIFLNNKGLYVGIKSNEAKKRLSKQDQNGRFVKER